MEDEFRAPFEPERSSDDEAGPITSFCVSPTNGRLEWVQAHIKPSHLGKGRALAPELSTFLLAGDKNPMDKPALLLHESLGGRGDAVQNVFLEGRSFDRETYDNEVESTVYYALQDRPATSPPALVTFKFIFKNSSVTRAYKIAYQVQLPSGDVIENELANV